jgi:hypothetical protein
MWGMHASVQFGIICPLLFPSALPNVKIEYKEQQLFLLFCMGVKLGLTD